MSFCPNCGTGLTYVEQHNAWYCQQCQQYAPPPAQPAAPAAPAGGNGLWHQNHYRIRKKVLTVGNKYWIEDGGGTVLGFSKQKLFRLKEDIRIFTDEGMSQELFRVHQQQLVDTWGTFAVFDSATNAYLGAIRRKMMASIIRDEWEVYDAQNQLVAGIYEKAGRGLARRLLPGGALIPEKLTLTFQGAPVAEIDQQFKVIGDIWDLKCMNLPPYLDRRVVLGGLLLMGMVERDKK